MMTANNLIFIGTMLGFVALVFLLINWK